MSKLENKLLEFEPKAFVEVATSEIRKRFNLSCARGILTEVDDDLCKAVSSLLCARAVGGDRVLAIHMVTSRKSIKRIRNVGKISKLGRFKLTVLDITKLGRSLLSDLPSLDIDDHGALRRSKAGRNPSSRMLSRLKGMILSYYADIYGYLVCKSVNKSELLLGVHKRTGELDGDLFPLHNLYRTHVDMLVRDLRISSYTTDRSLLKDLPLCRELSFRVLDAVLLGIENNWSDEEISSDLGVKQSLIAEIRRIVEESRSSHWTKPS